MVVIISFKLSTLMMYYPITLLSQYSSTLQIIYHTFLYIKIVNLLLHHGQDSVASHTPLPCSLVVFSPNALYLNMIGSGKADFEH